MRHETTEIMPSKDLKLVSPDSKSRFSRNQRIIDLAFLYASKSGAVVVGLIMLPMFNRLLGSNLFGVVSLIFTLQAIMLLVDFGMSTVVSRDLATGLASEQERFVTWRAAERVISVLYFALTLPVLFLAWAWDGIISPFDALSCLVLFWSLTIQNIGQSALLARHRFTETAMLQVTGVLARHGLSAVALACIAPTLTMFLFVQAVISVAQMLATRRRCIKILRPSASNVMDSVLFDRAMELLRTGKPLMLFGLSGAAVMQLDKIIVSGFMTPGELAPYYLAATFCLVPISVLAGPVAQLFQPRMILAVSSADKTAVHRTIVHFNYFIFACALLPSAAIWLLRKPLIEMWLLDSSDVKLVIQYSAILLPGIALGSLGYVPYTILVAKQDYQFQARFSLTLTTLTLIAVIFAALQENIQTVCFVYSIYHITSTIGSWWRCIRIDADGRDVALAGLVQVVILTIIVIYGTISLSTYLSQIRTTY